MSKDIIVLAPNGRRQTIHCTPDTSILQILEQACKKQGFQPADYDLKHHNNVLDLTTTIRFANLPNRATLEMVETIKKREESNVTIGLLLEDGERRTADFSPNTFLYDLLISLAPSELESLTNPTILYMRQEVTGLLALREKTLRHLGLIKGRAILRLLNKADEAKQANVSAVYSRPFSETPKENMEKGENFEKASTSNKKLHPIELVKQVKSNLKKSDGEPHTCADEKSETPNAVEKPETFQRAKLEEQSYLKSSHFTPKSTSSSSTSITADQLERRLNIEDEVTFLGTQKAIAYMQPENVQDELEDLPDDFYELTIEEVRKLYHDLQQQRVSLENTPLITSTKRQELDNQTSSQKLNVYKNVVVRVQFPDGMILQGVFQPTDTIEDVINFVKEHLKNPQKPFDIFAIPLRETLDPKITLADAKFVPCVHMHFKWLEEGEQSYLKEEAYTKTTTSDAASILASKYRAPSRRKSDETSQKNSTAASTSKDSKVPKWFKK